MVSSTSLEDLFSPSIPTLPKAIEASRKIWANDLQALLENAKSRFADVQWVDLPGKVDDAPIGDPVWGHKAIIYVRAPKSFKDRYFTFPNPSARSLSANLNTVSMFDRSVSALSHNTQAIAGHSFGAGKAFLSLSHHGTPELLRSQLQWLYTAQGGIAEEVTEWINRQNDSPPLDGEGADHDRLSQDLTYMWRSKLYTDCIIRLQDQTEPFARKEPPKPFRRSAKPIVRRAVSLAAVNTVNGTDSDRPRSAASAGPQSEDDDAGFTSFSAHRFILCSRSPYFAQLLLNSSAFASHPASQDTPSIPTINLPSPPFTAASLHFIIGYIYSGTLTFSNRTIDLGTAFAIHRGATYLELDDLVAQVESHCVWDLCHGMRQCQCRKCLQRIPRVWAFSSALESGAPKLAARSKQYLVDNWADCLGKELAMASDESRDNLGNSIIRTITPSTVITSYHYLLKARKAIAHPTSTSPSSAMDWAESISNMLDVIEQAIIDITLPSLDSVIASPDFSDLIAGRGFAADLLEFVLGHITESLGNIQRCRWAPSAYQIIVGSLLLVQQEDQKDLLLPSGSQIRQTVEIAQQAVMSHIKRRWMQIRQENGFEGLEIWALKEISDDIEIPIKDLMTPPEPPSRSVTPSSPNPDFKATKKPPVPRLSVLKKVRSQESIARSTVASTRSNKSNTSSTLNAAHKTTRLSEASRLQATPAIPRGSAATHPRVASSSITLRSQASVAPSTVTRTRSGVKPIEVASASAASRTRLPSQPSVSASRPQPPASTTTPRVSLTTAERSRLTSAAAKTSVDRIRGLSNVSRSTLTSAVSRRDPVVEQTSSSSVRPKRSVDNLPVLTSKANSARPAPRLLVNVGPSISRAGGLPQKPNGTGPAPSIKSKSSSQSLGAKSRTTLIRSSSPVPPVPPMLRAPVPKKPSVALRPLRLSSSSSIIASENSKASPRRIDPKTPTKQKPSRSPQTTPKSRVVQQPKIPFTTPRRLPTSTPKVGRLAFSSTVGGEASGSTNDAMSVTMTPTVSDSELSHSDASVRRSNAASSPSSLNLLGNLSSQSANPSSFHLAERPRGLSMTSSIASLSRFHPALAFDPPKREPSPPVIQVDDDPIEHEHESGIDLRVGIPCIVSLKSQKAKFKASCRYIGKVTGRQGVFVGIEVSEQVATRHHLVQGDGSVNGRRYFKLTSETATTRIIRQRSASMLKPKTLVPRYRDLGGSMQLNSAVEHLPRDTATLRHFTTDFYDNWISPIAIDPEMKAITTRGLFVRPHEVVFVLGATE